MISVLIYVLAFVVAVACYTWIWLQSKLTTGTKVLSSIVIACGVATSVVTVKYAVIVLAILAALHAVSYPLIKLLSKYTISFSFDKVREKECQNI
jgi:hypothetical protein